MNREQIIEFLKSKLNTKFISKTFLFGSLTTNKANPNDCDIFIITNQTPYDENWGLFLSEIESIQIEFQKTFNLKLHATINTEKEFIEKSPFKDRILQKKIIKIF